MSDLDRDAIKAQLEILSDPYAGWSPPAVAGVAVKALAALEEAEAERDDLKMALTELMPNPVLVEGSWIPVAEWPKILGNFMRASDEYARESKAMWLRAESAERRIAAVEKLLEKPFYLKEIRRGFTVEDFSRPLVEANAIRAALHPVAETTESEGN